MFRGDITRLEDVMAGKYKSMFCQLPRQEREERENDVQDGHVTEENAYEQRADRGRYRSAVHAPCRWLLEDTRSSRPRREQVATNRLGSPGKQQRKEDDSPPLHHN